MSERSNRILKAIEDAGYSYGELADKTKIPKSALQRYATGGTEKVPIDRIEEIAAATGVSSAYLMGWDEEESIANALFDVYEDQNIQIIVDQCKKMNEKSLKRLMRYADLLLIEEQEEK